MTVLNRLLGQLFDVLFLPFRDLPSWVGVAVVSLVVSVGMLWVYKRTSDQKAIAAAKAKIHAGIFEIRLFSDDPIAIFRAQVDILRHNARYFSLALVPLAWMIVPLALVVGQLQFLFGYRGLEPGAETVVRARLADDWRADLAGVAEGERPPIALEAPPGVEVLTPAIWLPSKGEVLWRAAVREPGDYALTVKLGDSVQTKSIRAREGVLRRSPVRHAGAFMDQVLFPSEPPIPKGPLRAIEVEYPEAGTTLGMPAWLVLFFGLSIVFAFALKGRFGVTI